MVVGVVLLFISLSYGTTVFFIVGIPSILVGCAVAGGMRMPSRIPARDTLLYIGISLAIVGGVIGCAEYSVRTHSEFDFGYNRWTTIFLSAAVTFGYLLSDFRRHLRDRWFWMIYIAFMAVHFVALLRIFSPTEKVSFLMFIPVSLVELVVIGVLLRGAGFHLRSGSPVDS